MQPRSRKNKSRIGIGTPSNHSKMYPDAPASLICPFSFMSCPFLPAIISEEAGPMSVSALEFFVLVLVLVIVIVPPL